MFSIPKNYSPITILAHTIKTTIGIIRELFTGSMAKFEMISNIPKTIPEKILCLVTVSMIRAPLLYTCLLYKIKL